MCVGVLSGIRTRVSGVRATVPRPLADEDILYSFCLFKSFIKAPREGVEPPHWRVEAACTLRYATEAWRAGRELNPHARFCRASTSPENRLNKNGAVTGNRTRISRLASSNSTVELPPQKVLLLPGADSGSRTRTMSLEDSGPTVGRCPRTFT